MTEVERHFTSTAYIVHRDHALLLWHQALKMWLPPGGHCEPNEDPVQAAIREAREESGLEVTVVEPPGLVKVSNLQVLPPPAAILIEEIVRDDQPYHHHIDHVYFTVPVFPVQFDSAIPHGPHRWATREELAAEFSLPTPDGRLVPVTEDVRLLGLQALDAATGETR